MRRLYTDQTPKGTQQRFDVWRHMQSLSYLTIAGPSISCSFTPIIRASSQNLYHHYMSGTVRHIPVYSGRYVIYLSILLLVPLPKTSFLLKTWKTHSPSFSRAAGLYSKPRGMKVYVPGDHLHNQYQQEILVLEAEVSNKKYNQNLSFYFQKSAQFHFPQICA